MPAARDEVVGEIKPDVSVRGFTASPLLGTPQGLSVYQDGAKLYVANGRSDSVSVIDTAKNVRIKDIPVGKTPWGVAIFE